ncbi:MAG: DUF5343 domain-containing protein [Silvibacterium sp.]
MTETSEKTAPAAYLPFKTFLSSVEVLEQGLPKKFDRTMWRSQSGVVQGQIMSALRFFGLLNENDEPTPALHRLVESKEKRHEQVGSLLLHAYRDIINHDLTKMTPKMLDEAMGAYNVQGDTRRKAVAFFLRAARYADMPMSHLLESQIRNTSGTRRKRKKPNGDSDTSIHQGTPPPDAQPSPPRTTTKTVRLPSGTVITLNISADWLDMSPEERTYVFGLVDSLRKVPGAVEQAEIEEAVK